MHPEAFFAPGSAVFHRGEEPAFLEVGDPIGCQPECCGVGVWIRSHGDHVRWRPAGDRWNHRLLSAELEFDREEYLFTVEWARDVWTAQG
ncbi:hypothetical protein ACFVH6_06335 [Spirillospora sp. NPDC127200]